MMNTSTDGLICGFINPNKHFPSFVTVIFVMGNKCYARFPSGETELIGGHLPKPVTENYWTDNESRHLNSLETEIAFAFSREHVVVGTVQFVVKEIQKQQKARLLPPEELRRISEIITTLKQDAEASVYIE